MGRDYKMNDNNSGKTCRVFTGDLSSWLKKLGMEKMVLQVEQACQKNSWSYLLDGTNIEIMIPDMKTDVADIRQTVSDCFFGASLKWLE
jgi:hypothetical protein